MLKLNIKKSKLLLYIVILVTSAVTLFAAVKFSHLYEKYSWEKMTREQAEEKLKGEVARIQKIFLSVEQIPQSLAYVLEFSKIKREHLQILLNSVVSNNEEVFGATIAYEPNSFYKDTLYFGPYLYKQNGKIVAVNPSDTTYHYFSMDWYLLPKKLNRPVWIEPYFDAGSGGGNVVMSTYSLPFFSFNGNGETMKGIVAVDISLDWLSKTISSIKLSDNSYSMLVSETGTIISSPNPKWAYNESIFSLADEYNLPALRKVGRDLQSGKSGFVNIGRFGTKSDTWIYYKPIPANKWGVLLVIPSKYHS
jgi:sigma-B regulation protein RsbU (phosphoserine phosphatase)